ncbi:MAG: VOC family protein [Pseudomonadota bacterium]
MSQSYTAPDGARIGHVHLKVADLDRALAFYRDVLGFQITDRFPQAVFLASGDYHHHIGLNTWHSAGKPPAPVNAAGLYHTAILYPSQKDLAVAYKRVLDAGLTLDGAADHGVSLALYLRDPDQNGVELYWDKPRSEWPIDTDGNLHMVNERFDLNALLNLAA